MSKSTHTGKTSRGPAHVALITAAGTMTHIGRTVRHLVIGLLDAPMNLTVVAPQSQDVGALPSPPVKVLTYRRPRLGRYSRRAVEALTGDLARRNVEFLHCLDGRAHGLTRRLSELGGWPYFVSVQDIQQCRTVGPLGEHCSGIIAPSLALREALLAGDVTSAERIHLVRPGLRAATKVSCFARPADSTAIVVAGRLTNYDAFARALESFAALRAADCDCALFVLGNGPAEMRLRHRARELKLTHDVTFVDQIAQQKLPDVLRAADVMVYPAATGAMEIEILEAMAAGLAVLVGEPAIGDFVVDGETAISYDPADPADLTTRLRILLNDPDAAIRLASRALRFVQAHHSPAAMVAAMAELYRGSIFRGRVLKVT